VRRAQGRLGRLERDAGLLALTGVVCFAATSASATPAPAVFRLTISGTATADFDHTSAPVASGACEVSLRSVGSRSASFRSTRPTVIRIVAGRVQKVEVRAVVGTVNLTGENTSNEACSGLETHTAQPCADTTRTFRDARTTLSSTKAGSITLRPLRIRLQRSECPREPDEVVAAPLAPVPGPLRVSTATLANRRIARITLTASASRRTNYGSPEAGTLQQRAAWTLTFKRVRP
jgi:hypothetical protein